MSLEDAVQWFLLELRVERKSANTIRTYQDALKKLARYAQSVGRTKLSDLTATLVKAAAVWTMDNRTSPLHKGGEASARLVVVATKSMAERLAAQGVPVNDLSMVTAPRVPQRVQVRVKPHEFRALEHAVTRRLIQKGQSRALIARDLALLAVCADTGLRAIELSRLNAEDLDLQMGVLTVYRGKGERPRKLSIWDPDDQAGGSTVGVLKDYLYLRAETWGQSSGPLFLSHKGQRLAPGGLRRILKAICRAAGLDGNRPPHAFRRATFTEAYQANPLALPVLTQRMGWSPKSRGLIDTYVRGAEIDFSGSTAVPLMSKRWRTQKTTPANSPNAVRQPGERRGW